MQTQLPKLVNIHAASQEVFEKLEHTVRMNQMSIKIFEYQ